jgi:hypothetical protein
MIDGEFLSRLVGSAIVRATCIEPGESVVETDGAIACHALTRSVERLRSRAEKAELAEQRERATARVDRLTEAWRVETARLQAEVSRLRARVRVEAEDVERAGVTRTHIEAWLVANEWTTESMAGWLTFVAPSGEHVDVWMDDWRQPLAKAIIALVRPARRCGLDILDEMAATTPPAPARGS